MVGKPEFPKGFFWGSATSSYQVEGGIENNDWAEAGRQGRVPPAGRACDHYNLYEKDFNIAKSLGQNAHHFSIEWSRIEPEEGKFDESEIEHCRKVIWALRERGIEPFVTLWHFSLPVWFAEKGGFENSRAPFYFSRYCGHVVKKLGQGSGAPRFWVTINEPMVCASQSFLVGKWPPFRGNVFVFLKIVGKLATSHNIVYRKIKSLQPNAFVGITKHNISFESDRNPLHCLLAKFLIWFWNHRFLQKIGKYQDFIGLNYYFHKKFGGRETYEKSDMGWDIYPKGIYNVLMELKKYRKPIYITENGLADAKDARRAKFIKDHLHWINRAVKDGADARGYFYWSLLDSFEWEYGFGPRFGLVEVNFKTMERRIRPSAYEYAKICKENRLEIESLEFL